MCLWVCIKVFGKQKALRIIQKKKNVSTSPVFPYRISVVFEAIVEYICITLSSARISCLIEIFANVILFSYVLPTIFDHSMPCLYNVIYE